MAEPQESGTPWPPPGLPPDARIFQLANNSKKPPHGYMGGYHNAVHWSEALIVPGPKFSYGMELDGQFLLADLDSMSEQALAQWSTLPDTWTQRTWSGKLHRVYRTPADFLPTTITWYLPDGKTRMGDLKANGYAVMVGSTVNDKPYVLLDGRDPVPAPLELLTAFEQAQKAPPAGEEGTRDRILIGDRDFFVRDLAGHLRRKRFSELGMKRVFWAIAQNSEVFEQSIAEPWLEHDAARVAHSYAKKPPGINIGPLISATIRTGAEVDLIGAPRRWLVPDFVPMSDLTLMYGEGGCGKSSWLSWLAAEATRRGLYVLYFGVEERFELFALRAVMGGADRALLHEAPNASRITFPDCAGALEDLVDLTGYGLVLFDSIYTHFGSSGRDNFAVQTRKVVGSLAEVTQRTGTTIVGGFHPNKGGSTWSGSEEMKNVPRCLLNFAREDDNNPLTVIVEKANFTKPRLAATFIGNELLAMDPDTGKVAHEERDGELRPLYLTVDRRGPDVPVGKKGKGKTVKQTGVINLGDVDVRIDTD